MGKIKKWIGDFETSTGNSDNSTNVYLWGIKSTDKNNKHIGVDLYSFFDTISKNAIRFIYFHNLSWDGNFILHWLLENGYTPVNDNIKKHELEEGEFSHLITDTKKIFKITVRLFGGHLIEFGDTVALLPMSVEKMGKILNYPKGEIDYDEYKHFNDISEVPSTVIDYLWRDIDIVVDFYNGFSSVYKGHKMTIGSTALESFKKHYGRYDYTRDFGGKYRSKKGLFNNEVLTKDQWLYFKQFYKGGYTQGNEKLRNKRIFCPNGNSADVNSMYPGVMEQYLLPYGKPLEYEPEGTFIEFQQIFILKTWKIDDDMPAHLHNPKGRLNSKVKYVDEGARFFAFYIKEEIEELKKTYQLVEGVNYTVIKRWYFKTKYSWRDWITTEKEKKINAKNGIERETGKLAMNSPYGKTGEKFRKGRTVFTFDDKMEEVGTRFGKHNEWVMTKDVSESDDLSYVPMAATITAYARIILLKAIRANKKSFLYADTDSIYSSEKIDGIPMHESKLGYWKPELRFTSFKWIKPKCYLADVIEEYDKDNKWIKEKYLKKAIAGLTLESQGKVNWDNFNEGNIIEKGKRQKKNVKGGLILVDIDYTL